MLIMQDRNGIMKKKSRGFALLETLIVSTIIASIMIYMFVQFNSLQNKYNESLRYNDVDDLYKLDSIKSYIISLSNEFKQGLISKIESDSLVIIAKGDTTYTNLEYIDNQEEMLKNLNIKNFIITKSDVSNISMDGLSKNIKNMIKKINNKSDNYRFIVEFDNENIATITFNMEVS